MEKKGEGEMKKGRKMKKDKEMRDKLEERKQKKRIYVKYMFVQNTGQSSLLL